MNFKIYSKLKSLLNMARAASLEKMLAVPAITANTRVVSKDGHTAIFKSFEVMLF